MSTETADTRSPWYETFTPTMWMVAPEAEETSDQPAEATEDDWATEALFDYYND